jgi:hypothetical protein
MNNNGTTNSNNGTLNNTGNTNNGTGTWNNGSMNNNNGTMNNGNMSTTGNYSAYGATSVTAPSNIQSYMMRDYPSASDVMWQQQGDWYHGTYLNNGRYNHVYYNEAGATYSVALPVTQTWMPDEVINKMSSMFGPSIYDIAMIKGAGGQNIYHVRLSENGQMRSQYIGEDGTTINDPFVTDHNMNNNMQQNLNNGMNSNMNSTDGSSSNTGTTTTGSNQTEGSEVVEMKVKSEGDKTKIETKTKNGKETKVKIKDGKMKVKEKD